MSKVFDCVYQWPCLDDICRVDPYLACIVHGDYDQKFGLLVTDDPWNAWFVTQCPVVFLQRKVMQAGELIHGIGKRPGGRQFKFEYNDGNGMVRAIYQLPVANEPRWEDDVHVAMFTLITEWSTLLPFLHRIEAGDLAIDIIDDAKRAFAAKDARAIQPLNRAG